MLCNVSTVYLKPLHCSSLLQTYIDVQCCSYLINSSKIPAQYIDFYRLDGVPIKAILFVAITCCFPLIINIFKIVQRFL